MCCVCSPAGVASQVWGGLPPPKQASTTTAASRRPGTVGRAPLAAGLSAEGNATAAPGPAAPPLKPVNGAAHNGAVVPVRDAAGSGIAGAAPEHASSGIESLGGAPASPERRGFDGEKLALSHDQLVAKVCCHRVLWKNAWVL